MTSNLFFSVKITPCWNKGTSCGSFYELIVGAEVYCCTSSHSLTHSHTRTHSLTHTHSVELFGTRDRPAAQTSTCTTHNIQNRETSKPPLGGIRTHIPSKRAAADPRLRPRGYWNRQLETCNIKILLQTVIKKKPFRNSEAFILSRYRQ